MPAKNNTCCFYNERRKVIYFCRKAKRPVSILLCTLTGHETFISSLIFMGNQLSHKIQGAICRKTPASDLPAGVLEVTGRFELPNEGFADPCLTTWPRHHIGVNISTPFGAADEARTRYLHLGKVALYQMSYGRISQLLYSETAKQVVPPIGIEPMTRGFSVPCSTD